MQHAAHGGDGGAHDGPRLPPPAGAPVGAAQVPKRLRYFMQRDGAVLNMVLRIFLRVIAQSLQSNSPGAAQVDKAALRLIAFITHSADIRQILNHIGVESEPPHISPARGPPLWEGCEAQVDDGVQSEPDWETHWEMAAQPAPDYEVDRQVNW